VNASKPSNSEETSLKIAIGQGYEPIIKYLLKWLPSRENLVIGEIYKDIIPNLYKTLLEVKTISCYSFSEKLNLKRTTNLLAYPVAIRDEEMDVHWWFKEETQDKALNAKNTIICVSLDESEERLAELKLIKKGKKCKNLFLLGCPIGYDYHPLKKFAYDFYVQLSPSDIAGIFTKLPEDILLVILNQIRLIDFMQISKSCFYLAYPLYFTRKYNTHISHNNLGSDTMNAVAKTIGAKYLPFMPEVVQIDLIKIWRKKNILGF